MKTRGLPALAVHEVSRFLPLLLVKMLLHMGTKGQSKTLHATGGMQQQPIWTAALSVAHPAGRLVSALTMAPC